MIEQKTETQKRLTTKFYIKEDDSLKIEQVIKTLKKRGWRIDKIRIQDFILDELFLKADKNFYERIISELTPLEYLFKESLKNPSMKKEMEKLLKKKQTGKK